MGYRLTAADYSNGDYYHYTYDAVGNRLTQQKSIIGLVTTDTYVYDDANRLTSVNGVNYTWDNNGNLLNDGVNVYTYNAANRLKTMTGPSVNASYGYNGMGDRLQQIHNGQTTNFMMDYNTGLTQALNDGTNTYIYGNGRIAQVNTSTDYFLGDALGSVRQLTNTSGAITYASAYDPYGVTTQTYGASQTAYGYTGEYSSNDLVYLRSRMYDPASGRFITKDSWRGSSVSPTSYNTWLYAHANPIRYVDPTGYCIDQPDSPQRCIVEPGDRVWTIASDRGLNFEAVVVWNRTVYGNDWNPDQIWPGNTIYLEDPFPAQPVIPTPAHPGELFNGYIEGTGFTFVALFAVLHAEGKEVVYDFETLQRAEVTYQGEPMWLGIICGVSTDLLGIGKSWYTGFFHFPLGDEEGISAYGNLSGTISVGVGGLNPLAGPLGAFTVGAQVTAFISTGGEPIFGIPTATNYGRVGATVSITEGGSVARLPITVETMNLNYQIGPIEQYYSAEAMALDILKGKGTEFGVANVTGLIPVSRGFFANKLLQIYTS